MSTNFPASVDTYTNPAPTDTLDSVSVPHAGQHDNLNDAMTAVQTYALANGLLTGSGVPAGGTGVNTNLYLDTASGIIYRKTAGTWAAIYTPAGGGDSRTHDPGVSTNSTNAGSSNRKGVLFTPSTNLTLTAVTCEYVSLTANQTHNAVVCTLVANTGSTTIATVVGTTTLLTMASSATGVAGGKVIMSFATGLALTSGTTYCILPGTPSDAGGAVGQQIFVPAFNGAVTLTNPPGSLGDWAACGVAAPIVGSAVSVVATTVSRPAVGFTAK